MEALAATVRHIDKRSVTESSNVTVHDRDGAVLARMEDQPMVAGDFYFRTQTVSHYERSSWFRRVILRQREKLITQSCLTVVLSCPYCGLPILTPITNEVLYKDPLTLERPLTCPYRGAQGTHSFWIKDGQIMPA